MGKICLRAALTAVVKNLLVKHLPAQAALRKQFLGLGQGQGANGNAVRRWPTQTHVARPTSARIVIISTVINVRGLKE